MSSKFIAAAVLGLALAGPALAQSSQSSQGGSGSSSSGSSSSGQQAQSSGQQRQQGQSQIPSQERIRQQLSQAGFQNVQVLDASYLVRARTQSGETVLMVIDAAGMQGGGAAGMSGSSSGASGSGTGGSGSQQGSGSGRTQ